MREVKYSELIVDISSYYNDKYYVEITEMGRYYLQKISYNMEIFDLRLKRINRTNKILDII